MGFTFCTIPARPLNFALKKELHWALADWTGCSCLNHHRERFFFEREIPRKALGQHLHAQCQNNCTSFFITLQRLVKHLDISVNCFLLGQLWEGLAGAWGCWCLSPTLAWAGLGVLGAWEEFLWVSGRVKWQMEKKCLCSAEPR